MQAGEPMQHYRKVAAAAAQQAGKIIADAYRTDFQVYYKQGTLTNLVTEVDRRSEAAIVEVISAAFPEHHILAEEGGEASRGGSPYRWYVDPLDGTTNFAHGFPMFCVSLAVEHRSASSATRVAAVVYDPTRDELFCAEAGKGAQLNGKAIHVSKIAQLKESLVSTGFPSHKRHKNPNIYFYHQIT